MPDTDELLSIDELKKAYNVIAPVWDDDVWSALQDKRFDLASTHLENALAKMSADDWGKVHWMGLVDGIPMMMGGLDQSSWKTGALPAIGKAAIMAASPAKLGAAYASLEPESLETFHNFLIAGVPGKSITEKSGWLKTNQSQIYNFFLSNPAGLHLAESPRFLSDQNIRRLDTMPENLRLKLFYFQNAEIVRRVAEQNNVPEEKIPVIADGVGLVLLGFIHPEDLGQEIKSGAGLARQAAEEISAALNARIFRPIRTELDNIYAPLPHDHELEKPAPKIIEEIKPPTMSPEKSGAGPLDISKIFGVSSREIKIEKPPQDTMPAPTTEIKTAIKPENVSRVEPSPTPFAKKESEAEPVSEFERLGLVNNKDRAAAPKFSPGETTASAVTVGKASTQEPTIIFRGPEMKLPEKSAAFKLETQIPKFSEAKPGAPPLRPAILEFGTNKPDTTTSPLKATEGKTRVVNYSELKTSLVPPLKSNVGKDIREITAEAPIPTPPPPGSRSSIGSANTPSAQVDLSLPGKSTIPPPVKPPTTFSPLTFTFGAKKTEMPPAPPKFSQSENIERPAATPRGGVEAGKQAPLASPPLKPEKPPLLGDEKMMHPSIPPTSPPPAPRPRIEPPPVPPKL